MSFKMGTFHKTKTSATREANKLLRQGKGVQIKPYISKKWGKGYAVFHN